MIKKFQKIFDLSKIFFINNLQNPYLINSKTNRINKKSPFVWLSLVVIIALSYVSMHIIDKLYQVDQAIIFVNILLFLLMIIMAFQVILASTNVYFFSKDLELILPLPIKPEELLISKFNAILINLYYFEFIFALFPLIIYGICTKVGILYYIYLIIILFIIPIFVNLIISILMMLMMKLSKFIKNKDLFQIIITIIFLIIIFFAQFLSFEFLIKNKENSSNNEQVLAIDEAFSKLNDKISDITKFFIIIKPSTNILENYNNINGIINLLKIIFIIFIFYILFIIIGKKYYLKNILKNNNYYLKNKKNKYNEKINKKNKINKSYVKKEFKILIKNPAFFMQCIFPTLLIIISLIIILSVSANNIREFILSDIFLNKKKDFEFGLRFVCTVLGIIQIILTNSNVSISAVSREGKQALYMKFLPIDLYKQFLYKSFPQIIINMIIILTILIGIKIVFPIVDLLALLFIFIIANLLNILNSQLMVVVDFNKPNLNWKVDYEAIKNNNNKLFQYVLTVIIILLLIYFNKILKKLKLIISCIIIIILLLLIILLINKIIKINIKKLYKKIY